MGFYGQQFWIKAKYLGISSCYKFSSRNTGPNYIPKSRVGPLVPKMQIYSENGFRVKSKSLSIDQGGHPRYIQSLMGRSSITFTMDTCGHLTNTVNRESEKRLDSEVLKVNCWLFWSHRAESNRRHPHYE
jgi:hypothetical protein